jgi:hypothetical protein
MSLTKENALAFVRRGWGLAREHKDRSMQRFVEVRGVGAVLALGEMLYRQNPERARAEKAGEKYVGLIRLRKVLKRAHRSRWPTGDPSSNALLKSVHRRDIV